MRPQHACGEDIARRPDSTVGCAHLGRARPQVDLFVRAASLEESRPFLAAKECSAFYALSQCSLCGRLRLNEHPGAYVYQLRYPNSSLQG